MKDPAVHVGRPTGTAAAPLRQAGPVTASSRATPIPVTGDKLVRAVALGLALLAHAAVLYALAREPDDVGGGGQQLDAISVTIVSSNLLESREVDRSQPSAPAGSDMVDAAEGAPVSEAKVAAERREEKKSKEEPQEERRPQEEPIRAAQAIFEMPRQAETQRKQEAAAPAGAAAARSDTPNKAEAKAPAAASAGAVLEYSRNVVQALRKTRPKSVGGSGTVRVKFKIAADGRVTSAEIAKSSGSKKLDDLALDAVQRTKFATPPTGMTSVQLFYEMPYYFR